MEQMVSWLREMCEAPGVSGLEHSAGKKAEALLRAYIPDAAANALGNVTGVKKSAKENAKTILLDAHIDEIGLIVTDIDDKGFLRVSNCGGVDRRLLAAQVVTVHGKRDLFGLVGSKPPHLLTPDEAKKVGKIEDLFIDVGMTKEEVEAVVSLGDRITVESPITRMKNHLVCGKALDDRAGCAAILWALELLKDEDPGINVAVQFTAKEEVGGYGAQIGAYGADADYAIAVDVGFAKTPDADPAKCGELGKGAMIGYSALLDKKFCDTLVTLAKEQEIPYQYDVMGGRSTGTNADSIFNSKCGVRTALISIPQRYMHTPVEVVSTDDLKAVGALIAAAVRKAGADNV